MFGEFCSALVARLFRWRGPTTILWAIVAVRVNTINSHSFRSFAHIGNKIVEVLPSIVDRDAPRPIPLVRLMACDFASFAHPLPDLIRWRKTACSGSGVTMFALGARHHFFVQASARTGVSGDNVRFVFDANGAAVASDTYLAASQFLNDDDAPVSLSGSVHSCWQNRFLR